jgi:hypothetical protein
MTNSIGRFTALALMAVMGICPMACGGGDATTSKGGGGVKVPPVDSGPQLLNKASLSGVHSGWFEAFFDLDNETKGEEVQWRTSGPFLRPRKKALQVNAQYEVAGIYDGTARQGRGGLLVLNDQTLFRRNGKAYRWLGSLSGQGSSTTLASGCQQALEGIKFDTLVKKLRSNPNPEEESTMIEGNLRLHAVLNALSRLNTPSACGGLLAAAGVSSRTLSVLEAQVKGTFKKSVATFTVGWDHVLTGLELGIWVNSPAPKQEEVDGRLIVTLSSINEISVIRESPGEKSIEADSQQPTTGQRGSVEAWVGLVGAVFGSLEGG